MRRLSIIAVHVFLGATLIAQDGSLDLTFNPGDAFDPYPRATIAEMSLGADGNVLLSGAFEDLQGLPSANLVRLDVAGDHVPSLANNGSFNGSIGGHALAPDGKIIVFGDFTEVQGFTRQKVVRLLVSGEVDLSFDAGTTFQSGSINGATVQADGKVVLICSGTVRVYRLNTDGTIDPSFTLVTQAYGNPLAVLALPNGRIVIGGSFNNWTGSSATTSGGNIVVLNSSGLIDPGYNLGGGANAIVYALALDDMGRILVGGYFSTFADQTRHRSARIGANGSLDGSFVPSSCNGAVHAVVPLPNGSVLIGGGFTTYNGAPANKIVRLNPNGTRDLSFDLGTGFAWGDVHHLVRQADDTYLVGGTFRTYQNHDCASLIRLAADGSISDHLTRSHGTGFDVQVNDMVVQPDGKIICVGLFRHYFGQPVRGVCRLLPNGGLDPTFNADYDGEAEVHTCALQSDGKVIIGGRFASFGTSTQPSIVRLNTDGSVDSSFDCLPSGGTVNVRAIKVQPDGLILIGGTFSQVNGVPRSRLARLLTNGSTDASFTPSVISSINSVYCIELQMDGKVLIGGWANGIGSQPLQRLLTNGSNDASFVPGSFGGFSPELRDIEVQPDGNILVSGYFLSYSGQPKDGIARLFPTGAVDPSFTLVGYDPYILDEMELDPQGDIYVSGSTTTPTGVFFFRLDPDGAQDPAFVASISAGSYARAIKVLPDGRVLTSGGFTGLNATPRHGIARFNGSAGNGVSVAVGALLQGPFDALSGLMSDALRTGGWLPLLEPYTSIGYGHEGGGGEIIGPDVLNISGADAPVDWVVLELRSNGDPSTVLATRSALLQCDGDVVDLDGASPVHFPVAAGTYHVAVRHRNHLGVMTASPVVLSSAPAFVDLRDQSTQTYGVEARVNNGGTMLLWAGNVVSDAPLNAIKYTGTTNDRDPILQVIGGSVPTATVAGYYSEDVNLNGVVKYTGSANDRDPILINIGGTVPTAVRTEQLP